MMEAFPHAEIHELYGASEGGATKISPEEWRARPGSVGRPWPGVEIRILDEDGSPVPTGESGLVYIRPPGRRGSPTATTTRPRRGLAATTPSPSVTSGTSTPTGT